MRIADIQANDFIDGEGTSVSLWVQGCGFHCKNCHNPETWNPDGGTDYSFDEIIAKLKELLTANGIQRNLSILGGEPLYYDEEYDNRVDTAAIATVIKNNCPNVRIFLWTGYKWEDIYNNPFLQMCLLPNIDVLIDGQYIEKERDITLWLRGSRNQRVIDVKESLKAGGEVKLYNKA